LSAFVLNTLVLVSFIQLFSQYNWEYFVLFGRCGTCFLVFNLRIVVYVFFMR